MSIYRNLRESYEFRRRYDEAGKFFIREMELKRKYKPIKSIYELAFPFKQKNKLERNISLTGLYYNLSRYGENLRRLTLLGIVIIIVSTFLFVTQSNPNLIPTFPISFLNPTNDSTNSVRYIVQPSDTKSINNTMLVNSTSASSYSYFIGLDKAAGFYQWQKAFDRSIMDFIPLLPVSGDIKTGFIDYVIKMTGVLIFGLIVIGLRRRFERKYYH